VKLLSQSGEAQTTLRGVKGKTVIEIAGEGTLIDGFTITGGTGRPQPSSYGFDYYGGGIHCRTTATVKNCIIRGNGAGTPGRDSATFGGAIYSVGSATDILTVENCVLAENYAWASGGATLTEVSKIILDRVTVYKNDSRNFFGYQGGASLANGGKMDLMNSILWANGGDQIGAFAYPYNRGTVATVTYTLSQGGVTSGGIETFTPATGNGTGNISADPKLNNPNAGDYSLQAGSPAINTANPVLKDPDNTRADMGYQAGRRSSGWDSDGDGVNDYRETYDGTNPFDAKSFNPLSVGLVAHYPFEGNAKDESGFNFNGNVLGATLAKDRFSEDINAYNFSGNEQYIQIPKNNYLENGNEVTLSVWYKFDGNQSGQLFAVGDERGGYDPFSMRIGVNGFEDFGVGSATAVRAEGALDYKDKIWRNIVMVMKKLSNTSSELRVYLDGTLVNVKLSNNLVTINYEGMVSQIGAIHASQFWKGDLDDFRFYNRALTAAEVSQLYSEESGEPNMVLVQGGTLPAGSALANQTVSAFHIARFETTWAEWKAVRTWAVANGYNDLANVGQGSADNHPVRNVSWYDTVKWLNAKSQMEGLVPVYTFNGTTYKTGQSTPTVLATANGYRLPAEDEWEWAARGGVASNGYSFSGSNNINEVAWIESNSMNASVSLAQGRGTWPVGQKAPNELGIFDMSGNVWEWLWDAYGGFERQITGGSWNHSAARALFSDSDGDPADFRATAHGFRYARNATGDMVIVQGGTLPTGSGLAGQKVQAFQIGRTEVTWGEWKTVRTWAAANGYSDLATVGAGTADNHPVQSVNWYEVLKWTNAKSQMEGLSPVYTVNGTTYKTGVQTPEVNAAANGYRLPVRIEWEWAARGGVSSGNFTYSGSNDINAVAWYATNSSNATKVVGTKTANELGIYDMSGNVWEWCWDYYNPSDRQTYGGCFNVEANRCTVTSLNYVNRDLRWPYLGLRLVRNIGPKISISGTLPEATLNQAYAGYSFGVVGSTGEKVWSISEGTLPPGMSFSANGTLSGTPTTAGTYTFVIRLESGGYWDEVEVELEVVAPLSPNLPYRLLGIRVDTDEVVEIDQSSGALRVLFKLPINVETWSGFARNPADASLYVTNPENGALVFYRIDLVAKTATKVKTVTGVGDATTAAIGFTNAGNVYAYDEESAFAQGKLYFINWASSTVQTLGTSGTPSILGGDFDNTRNVFWVGDEWNGKIYQLSLTNSSIQWTSTSTWPTGNSGSFLDMDVTPNGDVLVVGESTSAPGKLSLLKVDPDTKTWTKLFDINAATDIRIASIPNYSSMVTVQGGSLPLNSSWNGFFGNIVPTFQIGKYEVTWYEWQTVRTWALANGYSDLAGVGNGAAGSYPVQQVNWYDVVKWCNAKSQMEGLTPVYQVMGSVFKTGEPNMLSQIQPTPNYQANGYRLPLQKEWVWAMRGGVSSQAYAYSGSNDVNMAAWYNSNSGGSTKAVGTKVANELGIHDMMGNVAEWCYDQVGSDYRSIMGGSWNRRNFELGTFYDGPSYRTLYYGFRLARNTGN
jgi:formylglycine-generating enzyme required for sulfatase activity